MNQILATQSDNSNQNKKRGLGGNAPDITKIIVFFACAILVFGLIIGGVNIYRVIQKNREANKTSLAELIVEKIDASIRIIGRYEKGIEKIRYYWQEDDVIELVMDGRAQVERLIDIPRGAGSVVVQLVGVDGETIEQRLLLGTIIEISPMEDAYKIKIVATNVKGLQYITYQLNDGDKMMIDADPNDNDVIEIEIDIDRLQIDRGEYTLTVVAMDIEEQETTVSKKIEGKYEPEIEMVQNGDVVDFKVTHEKGFKKIEIEVNGSTFIYDENSPIYDATLKEFGFPITLQPGENIIIVTAYSLEGTSKTRGGRVTYVPIR